jgi:hypothetical protein
VRIYPAGKDWWSERFGDVTRRKTKQVAACTGQELLEMMIESMKDINPDPGGDELERLGVLVRRTMRAGVRRSSNPWIGIAQISTFQVSLRTDAVAVNEISRATYSFEPDVALTFPLVKAVSSGRPGGGYSQAEGLRQSRKVGLNHHLIKPVDLAHLMMLRAKWCKACSGSCSWQATSRC